MANGTNVGGIWYEVAFDTKGVIDGRRVIDREVNSAAAAFNKITQAVKLYAAAMALVKSAQQADDFRLLGARVAVAAGSMQAGAEAMAELQRVSARTQTDLASNAAVFARLNSSIRQMGGTQADTLRLTEILGKAIKVSGASAVEASAAMLQFGQALASGKLQGDELRSLLENAPYLMQQLADGIGVPVGQLRKLGEEGKLTADVVTQALGKAAARIESDFAKIPQTLSGAMAAASDAAARANEAFDTMTGTSAALTGATQGVATVLDQLAQQFRDATTEADRLGRNDAVRSWAETTTVVLTYVLDAVDFTWRGFRQLGVVVYESAMIAKAAATGGLREAGERLASIKAQLLDIGNAKFAGQKIREALDMRRVEDRGFTPTTTPSRLKGAAGDAGSGSKFDALAYLARLREATASEYERIGLIEEEALRKNAKQEGLSLRQREEAATLIRFKAAQDRQDLALREAEEYRRAIEEAGQKEVALRERLSAEQARGRELAQSTIAGADPVMALQLELERKSAMLAEYAAKDQENAELYAQARVALEQQTWDKIREVVQRQRDDQAAANSATLQNYSGLFGSMADLTKTFAGKQSGAYKAMFAVSKAFAIADSIIKIQQGIANSLALPFPANLAAAASTAATAAGIVATIRGTNYGGGRLYGGPTMAGSLYKVNENGRPEMFTAANGAQYMLPTTDGRVTAAGAGGAAVQVSVQVTNTHPTAQVSAQADDTGRIVRIAVSEIAGQIDSNSGPVFSALTRSTNVRGRLS